MYKESTGHIEQDNVPWMLFHTCSCPLAMPGALGEGCLRCGSRDGEGQSD